MAITFDPAFLEDAKWMAAKWDELAQIFDGKLVKVYSVFETIDGHETTEQAVDISVLDLKNIEFTTSLYLYGHSVGKIQQRKIFSLDNIVAMTTSSTSLEIKRQCKTYRHEIRISL